MGAPAGRLSAFIEVPFTDGDRHLRPDGLIRVALGRRTWTALVEVEDRAARPDSRPDRVVPRPRAQVQVRCAADSLPPVDRYARCAPLPGTLAQGQIRCRRGFTTCRGARSVPRRCYSTLKRGSAIPIKRGSWLSSSATWSIRDRERLTLRIWDPAWVHVRDRARTATLHVQDKGAGEVADRFGWLVSFAAMHLSRELGTKVRQMVPSSAAPGPRQAPARGGIGNWPAAGGCRPRYGCRRP